MLRVNTASVLFEGGGSFDTAGNGSVLGQITLHVIGSVQEVVLVNVELAVVDWGAVGLAVITDGGSGASTVFTGGEGRHGFL